MQLAGRTAQRFSMLPASSAKGRIYKRGMRELAFTRDARHAQLRVTRSFSLIPASSADMRHQQAAATPPPPARHVTRSRARGPAEGRPTPCFGVLGGCIPNGSELVHGP